MIVLREANPDEYDDIAKLMLAAYAQYMPEPDAELLPEERAAWDGYAEEIVDVRSRVEFSDLIVAEEDGRILGAVTFYPPTDGPSQNHELPPEWAGFRLLAVPPEGRGRGIGRLLTEECIGRARALGATAIGLHTTHLMEVARQMYIRMGFVRVPEYDFFPMPEFTVEAYRLDL
jgi:GNAT superfamily N-acetyltransferase